MDKFTVEAYRVETGARMYHLDVHFRNRSNAEKHALDANSKAHTPFYFVVRAHLWDMPNAHVLTPFAD